MNNNQQIENSIEEIKKPRISIIRILILVFLIILISIGGFLLYFFKPIKIDSETIAGINDLGLNVSYTWDRLPEGIETGYLIKIKFKKDNKSSIKSNCIMEKYFAGDSYYCEAIWTNDKNDLYNLSKYSFSGRPTIDILWQKIRSCTEEPAPILEIKTDYLLPSAKQGEFYEKTIYFIYTGNSPLNIEFSNLPQGISLDKNSFEIKNQLGQVIISGIPTEGGVSHESFLKISSGDGMVEEIKQFNLLVEKSDLELDIIAPEKITGKVNQVYTIKFQATGGTPPYSWSYFDIWKTYEFCSDFIMESDGTLTIEKPQKGSCSLTITVQDSKGETESMLYPINIE